MAQESGDGERTPALRFDLHVHSAHSFDGKVGPSELVREAHRKGFCGMALTDHNSVAGIREATDAARDIPGFVLVPGIEISSRRGHVLAYGITEPVKKGMPVEETVEAILSMGGLPVAAHPYRSFTGIGEKAVRGSGFAAVEILNARSPRFKNERAIRLCDELRLGKTGGSDCHLLRELGRGYTVSRERPPRAEGLLEMIRKGATFAGGNSATIREVVGHSTKIGRDLLRRGGRRI